MKLKAKARLVAATSYPDISELATPGGVKAALRLTAKNSKRTRRGPGVIETLMQTPEGVQIIHGVVIETSMGHGALQDPGELIGKLQPLRQLMHDMSNLEIYVSRNAVVFAVQGELIE